MDWKEMGEGHEAEKFRGPKRRRKVIKTQSRKEKLKEEK